LLGQRLALAATGIAVASVLAGIGAWLGARSQGVDLGFGAMVRSGINLVPTALVVLGVGAVMLAFAPRAATRTVYSVVAGSLIVDVLGSTVSGTRWLEHLSLFHYMALAPAQDLDPLTLIITVTVAVVLCTFATGIFARRDLQLR
jgi:ABC-2 type transport system permease protein